MSTEESDKKEEIKSLRGVLHDLDNMGDGLGDARFWFEQLDDKTKDQLKEIYLNLKSLELAIETAHFNFRSKLKKLREE